MAELPRPTRGGMLRPFGLGMFIRAYLSGDPQYYGKAAADPRRGAPIDDIRSAYKEALLQAHAEDWVAELMKRGITISVDEALRRIPHRLTKIRSHSFYRYFHLLKQLGWVELTGEEEGNPHRWQPGCPGGGTRPGPWWRCPSPGASAG